MCTPTRRVSKDTLRVGDVLWYYTPEPWLLQVELCTVIDLNPRVSSGDPAFAVMVTCPGISKFYINAHIENLSHEFPIERWVKEMDKREEMRRQKIEVVKQQRIDWEQILRHMRAEGQQPLDRLTPEEIDKLITRALGAPANTLYGHANIPLPPEDT